jgi:hypothetical protein
LTDVFSCVSGHDENVRVSRLKEGTRAIRFSNPQPNADGAEVQSNVFSGFQTKQICGRKPETENALARAQLG